MTRYHKIIDYHINLIDQFLIRSGLHSIKDRSVFKLDDMSYSDYVKYTFNEPEYVKLEICFSVDGITIGVDRISEAFSWSTLNLNETELFNILKIIINCKIIAEYCGGNYTKLIFINTNNKSIKTVKYISGLYIKLFCKTKTYSPISDFLLNIK